MSRRITAACVVVGRVILSSGTPSTTDPPRICQPPTSRGSAIADLVTIHNTNGSARQAILLHLRPIPSNRICSFLPRGCQAITLLVAKLLIPRVSAIVMVLSEPRRCVAWHARCVTLVYLTPLCMPWRLCGLVVLRPTRWYNTSVDDHRMFIRTSFLRFLCAQASLLTANTFVSPIQKSFRAPDTPQ